MNKQQREYAIQRIDRIITKKAKEVEQKHTKPGKTLSRKEKADLLRAGKVSLRKRVRSVNTYDSVDDIFDFSAHEVKESKDTTAIDKRIIPLRKEAQRIKDELMLGDSQIALEAIRKLENM